MHWQLRNNTFVPLESLPTALLHGYSAYTSFRWPISELGLNAHLQRLAIDADALGMSLALSNEALMAALSELSQPAFETQTPPETHGTQALKARQALRLTVLPDVADYPSLFSTSSEALLILSCRDLPPETAAGVKLKSVTLEIPLARHKHGSMAAVIAAKSAARREGFDDILRLDAQARLLESSTANVFALHQGQLFTPDPHRTPCLPGITRQQAITLCQHYGIPYHIGDITHAFAQSVEGLFLSNAIQGLVPVNQLDTHTFPWPENAQALLEQLSAGIQRLTH